MRTKTRTAAALALVAAACLGVRPAAAQGRCLLDLEDRGWGGWAGPQFKPTLLAGEFCLYGGGPVVVLAGPSLGFGVNVALPEGDPEAVGLRYVTARGEYTLFPAGRFHLHLALDLGGGVASYGDRRAGTAVIEPQALLTVGLWRSFRLGLGASYRLALLLGELAPFSPLELSGPCGVLQLQYGLFPAAGNTAKEAKR